MKKKYKVYFCTQRDYNGLGVDEKKPNKTFVGETYAVSKAKACANISYRTGYPVFRVDEMWGDGAAYKWLDAIEL